MIKVSFLNDGSLHDATDFGAYFNKFVLDGVYTTPANALVVTNMEGLTFTVAPGHVFILGQWIENTSNLNLVADPTESIRVDRIVARIDHGIPEGTIAILKGTEGSTNPPALANSATKKELCLCEYTVTTLGVSAMADTRSNPNLCGFVQNFLGTVDASGLFATWQNEFDRVFNQMKASEQQIIDEAKAVFTAVEAESAGLFGSDGRQGFMNPGFRINQRGFENYSLGPNSGTLQTFDRWIARIGGRSLVGPIQISRVQDGSRLAMKVSNQEFASGSGTSGASCILQTIENGCKTFCCGKSFTVSFDAKADSPQRIAIEPVQFENELATGVTIDAQTVSIGTTWNRYSVTFNSTLTPDANSEDALKIGFFFGWINYTSRFGAVQNAANNIYFANMQINEGTEALPAYIPPTWADIQACKRYFRNSGLCQLVVGAQTTTSKQVRTQELQFEEMRIAPTFDFKDRNGVANKASLFGVSGLHVDNLTAIVSSNRSKGVSLVVTNTDVQACACVLGGWTANAEYNL